MRVNSDLSTSSAPAEQGTPQKLDRRAAAKRRNRLIATIIGLLLVMAPTVVPAAAYADTGDSGVATHCWGGRCEFLFSKSTTQSIAQGQLPGAAGSALGAATSILVLGHRIIAQQYANRGWCSAFLVSVWPWENQGYTGYACNWE